MRSPGAGRSAGGGQHLGVRKGAALAEDRGAASWRKSSYSGTNESNCCEVAVLSCEIRVRDSKRPSGTVLTFTPDAWRVALTLFSTWSGSRQSSG
ncbi:DUF397 domain-containing protein [Streptomyces sp. AHU1]|uniref:DUF397 domain-containing protein n=1 Tax=Streptomyces sp. AHU1 TaxID=3377215 RepID=UPI00387843A0